MGVETGDLVMTEIVSREVATLRHQAHFAKNDS